MSRTLPLLPSISMYVAATIFFVVLDSMAKYMTASVPLGLVVWARYASSFALLAALLPVLGVRKTIDSRHRLVQLGRGALLVSATTCMFGAVSILPVSQSYAISYISPILVVMLAAIFLGERTSLLQKVGVLFGFTGVLLVIRPGFQDWRWAMLLPLASAVFYASYQVLTRWVGKYDSPFTSLWYVTLSGTVLTSFLLPWSYASLHWHSWLFLGFMGAIGNCGHFLVIKAYSNAGASVLAPFLYLQLVWAALMDALVFSTMPDGFMWIGSAVIVGAGLMIIVGDRCKR